MEKIIFVVDDDILIVEMLKQTLSVINGIKIFTFYSGEDALLNLDLDPKIIILDYFLNSVNENAMNGLTVLKEFKNKLPEAKVVILSGQEDLEIVYKLNQYQADDYVIKDENAIINIKAILIKLLK